MLFKKSFIPLSVAMVLVLNSENYMAACLFFAMGMLERVKEKAEDDRIRVDEIIDKWEYEKEEHRRRRKQQKKNEED